MLFTSPCFLCCAWISLRVRTSLKTGNTRTRTAREPKNRSNRCSSPAVSDHGDGNRRLQRCTQKKHWKTNAKWNQSTYWAYTKLDSAEKGQFCLVIALSLFKAVGRRRTGARQAKRQFGTRTVHFATESLRFGPILDTQLINQIRKIAKPKTHIQRLGK